MNEEIAKKVYTDYLSEKTTSKSERVKLLDFCLRQESSRPKDNNADLGRQRDALVSKWHAGVLSNKELGNSGG